MTSEATDSTSEATGSEPFVGWPQVLDRLVRREGLPPGWARAALEEILGGRATDAQIGAFVTALAMKGETAGEMAEMVAAMLDAATPLEVDRDALDIVGTGGAPGRRRGALNVSTLACFVAAAAGAVVCKHGNRAASSTSGAFDLLDELGLPADQTPADVERCVREVGLGFAYARTFHPAMRHAAAVRSQLGISTIFNVLGPLAHPGHVRRQVVGVTAAELGERVVETLRRTGSTRAMVVSGHGSLDELSTTGPSQVLELVEDRIERYEVRPEDVGLATVDEAALVGGDARTNAEIARGVFAGSPGAARDIVVLNAAAGLVVAGVAADLASGVRAAQTAIDSGAAAHKLAQLADSASRH